MKTTKELEAIGGPVFLVLFSSGLVNRVLEWRHLLNADTRDELTDASNALAMAATKLLNKIPWDVERFIEDNLPDDGEEMITVGDARCLIVQAWRESTEAVSSPAKCPMK